MGRRAVRGKALVVGIATAMVLMFVGAQGAAADLNFCPPGSGAGQCTNAQGLATDFETDRLYVADTGNHRVNAFKASTGEFLFSFGSQGAAAGQLSSPRWIAIDNVLGSGARHDVYVVSNNRVNRFKPDGSFVHAFGWGVNATTPEEKLQLCTTASGCLVGKAGPNECQLSGNTRPVAVGPGGNVFIADASGSEPNFTARVQELSAAGACVGETLLETGNVVPVALVVDASKDAYLSLERLGLLALRKYDLGAPESKLCDLDPGAGEGPLETSALALDEAGRLFATQRERPDEAGEVHQVITEYDVSSCPPTKHVRRFGYRNIDSSMNGLAVLPSAAGDVFGSETGSGIRYLKFPQPGPLVAKTPELLSLGNTKAGVRVEVNPEGKATQVTVEWVDDTSFDADVQGGGNGFEGPGTKSETKALPTAAGIFRANAIGFLLGCAVAIEQAVEEGKCLAPSTEYHWRVIPTNADGGGEGPAVGPSFETEPPVAMEVFATAVSSDTATINARVNPLGIAATGFFEYVDEETFEASGFTEALKVPDVDAEPPEAEYDFGEGEEPVKRSATLFPLEPGTTYHYRLSAQNLFFKGLKSEERTFTTFAEAEIPPCPNEEFRNGAAALLPDCRAYELVSPLDKEGGDIIVLSETLTGRPNVLQQSASSGDRLAYGSYRAFGDAKSASYTSQYIAERSAAGWQSGGIDPVHGQPLQDGAGEMDSEWRFFSEDLCQGWVVPLFEPALAAGAIGGFRNLYRGELCGEESYEAFSTAPPEELGKFDYRIEPQGFSADGEIAAFAANDSLAGSGAPAGPGARIQLYVKGPSGGPQFACILPGGAPSANQCSAGTGAPGYPRMRTANVTNALSEDGSRLYWSDGTEQARIYLRRNPLSEETECAPSPTAPCTVAVSEEGEALSGTTVSQFWAAAADGSAAIFSSGNLQGGEAELYRYTDADEGTEEIAGEVRGFMGASEDAERIYFASEEAIAGSGANSEGEEAVAGAPNLYLYDAGAGSYRFVARIAGADVRLSPNGREQTAATARDPINRNARVTADGLGAAFMSEAPITGYDNTDAGSPAPCGEAKGICDNEVFVYDAEAGELWCASCNPSGARPAGKDFNAFDTGNNPFWAAARLVVWETTLRAPQTLSADGERLFFESQDALVARDTNKRVDIYQWERAGRGDCEARVPSFSAEAGGCIDLISSGQSARDAGFVDASPEGDEVFFTTLSSLVPEDYGLVDIYDARVGGGLPSPPPPTQGCPPESCQSPPPPPEFQAPGSSINVGPGNLAPPTKKATKRCPKGTRKVKREGKVRCVRKKAKGSRSGASAQKGKGR